MSDPLRPLWDFDRLDATEQRFRARLDQAPEDSARAEVLTQLARIEGLREDFDACDRMLEQAEGLAGSSAAAKVRIDLERGRMLRSSGNPAAALPLFEAAFARAVESAEFFLAADAAHMAALVDTDGMQDWTQRGIELTEAEPDAAYWAGPLLNNLGWYHFEEGAYEPALDTFLRALRAYERDPEKLYEIEIARYAIAKTLRALGRAAEAATLLEQCVSEFESDPYFHEELAECYATLGREQEAHGHARRAVELR